MLGGIVPEIIAWLNNVERVEFWIFAIKVSTVVMCLLEIFPLATLSVSEVV